MIKSKLRTWFDTRFLQEWITETGSLMILRGEDAKQRFLKQSLHRLLWYRLPVTGFTSLLSNLLTIYIHISTIQAVPYPTVGTLDTLLLFHYSFMAFPLELLGDSIIFQMTKSLLREPTDVEAVHRFYSLSLFMTLYYALIVFTVGLLFKQVYIGPYLSSKYDYSFNDLSAYLTIAPFVSPFLHLSNAILERTGFFLTITIQRIISCIATAVLLSFGYLFLFLYNTLVINIDDTALSMSNIESQYFSSPVFLYPVVVAILLPDAVFLCLNIIRMFSYESYKECYSHGTLSESSSANVTTLSTYSLCDAQLSDDTESSYSITASERITTTSHMQAPLAFQRPTILTRRPYSDTLYQHDTPFLPMLMHGKLFPKNIKVLINLIISLLYRWLSVLGHTGLALFIIVFLYTNIKDVKLFLLNVNICGVYIFVKRALFSLTIPISYIFKQVYFFNSRNKRYRKIAVAFYYYLFVALVASSLLGALFYFLLSPRFTDYYLDFGLQLTKSELSDNITILRVETLISPFLSLFYIIDTFLEQRKRILIGFMVKFLSLAAGCVALFYIWEFQKQFSDFSYPLLIADIVLCICGIALLPLVIFELQLLILETRVESRRIK